MITIALFVNCDKKNSIDIAIDIRNFLQNRNVNVVARDDEATAINVPPLSGINPKEIDFVISMGGDGTILRTVHTYPEIEAPILGVNLGHLGFMADIPISDIYPSLEDLLNGAYKIEERLMMQGITANNEICFAVNEMVVHRSPNPSLIDLALYVDGNYLNTFSADGIIFSTPSGSTAYSLAAGGPILTPELDAFVITPIAPHTISNRPIVLMPSQAIEVKYISEHQPIELAFDGIRRYQMKTGDTFKIMRSNRKFRLVSLLRRNFFSTLRTKLGWVGKLRT